MKYTNLPFLKTITLASGCIVILIGLLVITGWIFDIPVLKSLNPDYISMKANTAVCFIFSGGALLLLRKPDQSSRFRYLVTFLTLSVLIISAVNLFEYIFNWNAGIDELLFKEGPGATATVHPGRMAINTAVCFILISFSILVLKSRFAWSYLFSQFSAFMTGLLCILPQLGYAYQESDLFTFAYQTPMALNTAIAFFTLSIGIFFLRPTQGLLKMLWTEGPGGVFARRLFPVVFFLPVLLLWSEMALKSAGIAVNNNSIITVTILYGIVFIFAFRKIITKLNESDAIRSKTEEALKKSEEKYRRMFENVQDVLYQSDTEGKIIEISPSIYRIAGYRRDELIGQPVCQLFDELRYREEFVNEISNKGNVNDYEIRLKTKSGNYLFTSLSAHLRFSNAGFNLGIEGLIRPIEERKEFESKLEKAKAKAEETDRLKTAFLHNISHEIRTPLNAILGFGALLSDPAITKDEQASYLASIQEASDQLISIIGTLLDISGAEAKTLVRHETSFNLNTTLRNLHRQFSLKASENSNTLQLNSGLSDENAEIRTDSTRLIQIISNLLVNALKFTTNGKVEFGYKAKEGELEFYVFDNGIGIPADQHSRIFESFYQVDGALSRKYEGTGLGLSISKAYVELLGGRIWLTSAPGLGSQFFFTIPFEKKTELKEEKKNNRTEITLDGVALLTILVAEDNDINFNLIKSYLSGQNVRLLKAQNGKEAMDICSSTDDIDIILLDIRMPVMDGYTAAKMIKQLRPGIPLIAQTAYAEEKELILKSGFDDIIAKPFRKNELLKIIEEHMLR